MPCHMTSLKSFSTCPPDCNSRPRFLGLCVDNKGWLRLFNQGFFFLLFSIHPPRLTACSNRLHTIHGTAGPQCALPQLFLLIPSRSFSPPLRFILLSEADQSARWSGRHVVCLPRRPGVLWLCVFVCELMCTQACLDVNRLGDCTVQILTWILNISTLMCFFIIVCL